MIRSVPGGFVVVSKTGKRLTRVYKNRADAVQRMREIEYFKKNKPKARS